MSDEAKTFSGAVLPETFQPGEMAVWEFEPMPDEAAIRRATCIECAEMAEREANDYEPFGSAAGALFTIAARFRQMAEGSGE